MGEQTQTSLDIRAYPYPIAHAWQLAEDQRYGATVRHINALGCFYQCLRLSALTLAGWYLYRLPAHASMQRCLQQLQHPMMGQWLSLIRTALRSIYPPDDRSQYEPLWPLAEALRKLERKRWPIGPLAPNPPADLCTTLPQTNSAKSSTGLTPFAWFIQHRNTHHGHFATLTDEQVESALSAIMPRLKEVVTGLTCFCQYQLVHRDPERRIVTLLHGDGSSGFRTLPDVASLLFSGKGFSDEREQVALIYPDATLAIPLTLLVTRELDSDEFEGLVRFRTATIEHEPLFYDGIDNTNRSVVYLGSGTRSLRHSSFQQVKQLFDPKPVAVVGGRGMNVPDHLRLEAEAQLASLQVVKFQPHTYVPRQADHFLKKQLLSAPDAGNRPAVLIVGISGSGKTSLLCRFADELLRSPEQKHQVSLRAAEEVGGGQTLSLEHGLAADMGYHSGGRRYTLHELFLFWSEENRRRNIRNPYLWILWDALNEGDSLERLLFRAGEAAAEIAAWNCQAKAPGQVRLLLSCRREPWEELLLSLRQKSPHAWPFANAKCFRHFRNSECSPVEPYFLLPLFSSDEARRAYENYQVWAASNYAPYAHLSWKDLNAGQKKLLRIPLNCWLFHQTFSGQGLAETSDYTTARLWQRFLEHSVQRHAPMADAIEMFGTAMWEGRAATVLRSDLERQIHTRNENKQHELFAALGLTWETFSALPEVARTALMAKLPAVPQADPVELLYASGLLTSKPNCSFTPTYQTLAEAIAGWVLWHDLLIDWNPTDKTETTLESRVAEVQKRAPGELTRRLGPWLAKAGWPEGRTALLNHWGVRARSALEAGIGEEALQTLAELQLRGRTALVSEIIESYLPLQDDANFRLQLVGILIDMVHLRGDYRRAAAMIEKELAPDSRPEHKLSPIYWRMRIRLIHHRMFFSSVEPLWHEMCRLLSSLPPEIDAHIHGEILFMLGGNLGTLRGCYRESRKFLYRAIRLGREIGDDYLVCRSLRKLCDYLRHDQHFKLACHTWDAAWAISEKYLHTRQGVYLLCCRGDLERQLGNIALAREYFDRALTSAEDAYIPGWVGHCYLGRAELALAQGDLSTTEADLQRARSFYEQIGQRWGLLQAGIAEARLRLLCNDRLWEAVACETLQDSVSFGYRRDESFIGQILETHRFAPNCLMFL